MKEKLLYFISFTIKKSRELVENNVFPTNFNLKYIYIIFIDNKIINEINIKLFYDVSHNNIVYTVIF